MHTTFTVKQGSRTVSVPSDVGFLKISEEDGMLKIFVPKDNVQRQRCYRAHLPTQLMSFLDLAAQPAEKQLYRILNDRPSTLNEVLSEEGIPEASGLQRPDYGDDDRSDGASDGTSDDMVTVESSLARFSLTVASSRSPASRLTSVGARQSGESTAEQPRMRSGIRETIEDHFNQELQVYDDDHTDLEPEVPESYSPERYLKVLEHVSRRARAVHGSNTQEEIEIDLNSLTLEEPSRGDLGIQYGAKVGGSVFRLIGAAGELFVSTPLHCHPEEPCQC